MDDPCSHLSTYLGDKGEEKRGKKLLPCLSFPFPFPKTLAFILPLPFPGPFPFTLCSAWTCALHPYPPINLSPTSSYSPFSKDTLVPCQARQWASQPQARPLPAFWWVQQHRKSILSENSYPRHRPMVVLLGLASQQHSGRSIVWSVRLAFVSCSGTLTQSVRYFVSD